MKRFESITHSHWSIGRSQASWRGRRSTFRVTTTLRAMTDIFKVRVDAVQTRDHSYGCLYDSQTKLGILSRITLDSFQHLAKCWDYLLFKYIAYFGEINQNWLCKAQSMTNDIQKSAFCDLWWFEIPNVLVWNSTHHSSYKGRGRWARTSCWLFRGDTTGFITSLFMNEKSGGQVLNNVFDYLENGMGFKCIFVVLKQLRDFVVITVFRLKSLLDSIFTNELLCFLNKHLKYHRK